ncbi:hypothetical protein K458DRAFT_429598 [Lentithecium fluviatile CBS 122367]|uniref:Uncharacterized protein n=1 Tax=Lentithecium fluviatile CBS 122367 TaxID=1168545 RepID=A0A6G1J908_9PLEO|nr:hypothetical protein K458DRAFT_429598 [Lentithecium fluviatile CBS 122367]
MSTGSALFFESFLTICNPPGIASSTQDTGLNSRKRASPSPPGYWHEGYRRYQSTGSLSRAHRSHYRFQYNHSPWDNLTEAMRPVPFNGADILTSLAGPEIAVPQLHMEFAEWAVAVKDNEEGAAAPEDQGGILLPQLLGSEDTSPPWIFRRLQRLHRLLATIGTTGTSPKYLGRIMFPRS